MKVFYSSHFARAFRRMPLDIQHKATACKDAFLQNPYASSLGTHKLKGDKQDFWAFWVTGNIRIVFFFQTEHEVVFFDIGSHDQVYR